MWGLCCGLRLGLPLSLSAVMRANKANPFLRDKAILASVVDTEKKVESMLHKVFAV